MPPRSVTEQQLLDTLDLARPGLRVAAYHLLTACPPSVGADDLLQEATLHIWRLRDRVLAHASPSGLAVVIGRQAMVDLIRRARRQRNWTPREVPLLDQHTAEMVDNAATRVEMAEMWHRLHRLLLNREWWRVYAMLARGHSQAEIAAAVNLTPSGVSRIVTRLKEACYAQADP